MWNDQTKSCEMATPCPPGLNAFGVVRIVSLEKVGNIQYTGWGRGCHFTISQLIFIRFTIHKEIFTIFTFTTFYIEKVVKISIFHNSQISQPFFAWFHNSQLILGPFLKSQLLFNSQFLNFFFAPFSISQFFKAHFTVLKNRVPPGWSTCFT